MSGRVEVKIKPEHYEKLAACAMVTGRSVESLLDEAMADFTQAFVPSYIEGVAERAATA